MATHALHHYPAHGELPRWIIVGAISGAVAVLVFHQSAAALLHALEVAARAPYSLQPTRPFGMPALWSIVFPTPVACGRADRQRGMGPWDGNRPRAFWSPQNA